MFFGTRQLKKGRQQSFITSDNICKCCAFIYKNETCECVRNIRNNERRKKILENTLKLTPFYLLSIQLPYMKIILFFLTIFQHYSYIFSHWINFWWIVLNCTVPHFLTKEGEKKYKVELKCFLIS